MKRNRHAFTLIEMVVAMAVMLMVAMIIGTAGKIFYDDYRRSVRATGRLKEYMAIDRIWDGAVRNAVPFKWTDDEGASRFVFEGGNDTLMFTALRRSDGASAGALMFIRLRLEDSDLVAYYSGYPRPPWDEEYQDKSDEYFRREVLASGVSAVSFQYAETGESEDAEIEWLDSWEEDEHAAIPLAIRMTLQWNDGRREHWLRRTCGTSLHSTFGYRSGPESSADAAGGTAR